MKSDVAAVGDPPEAADTILRVSGGQQGIFKAKSQCLHCDYLPLSQCDLDQKNPAEGRNHSVDTVIIEKNSKIRPKAGNHSAGAVIISPAEGREAEEITESSEITVWTL